MSFSALVCAVIFCTWLLITIVCQFPHYRLSRLLKRHDYCALIPTGRSLPRTLQSKTSPSYSATRISSASSHHGMSSPIALRGMQSAGSGIQPSGGLRSYMIWQRCGSLPPNALHQAVHFCCPCPTCVCSIRCQLYPEARAIAATQLAIASVHIDYQDKPAQILVMSPFHRL
jgi:hypothetical protein